MAKKHYLSAEERDDLRGRLEYVLAGNTDAVALSDIKIICGQLKYVQFKIKAQKIQKRANAAYAELSRSATSS